MFGPLAALALNLQFPLLIEGSWSFGSTPLGENEHFSGFGRVLVDVERDFIEIAKTSAFIANRHMRDESAVSANNGGNQLLRHSVQSHDACGFGLGSQRPGIIPMCDRRVPRLLSNGTSSIISDGASSHVERGGRAVVLQLYPDDTFGRERKVDKGIAKVNVRSLFRSHDFKVGFGGVSGAFGLFRPGFCVTRRPSCENRGGHSGSKCCRADNGAKDPKAQGDVRGTLRFISGLPLSAKIGGTVVLAVGAWFVMLAGFLRLLDGRGQIVQGVSYLVVGALGWIASYLFWVGS